MQKLMQPLQKSLSMQIKQKTVRGTEVEATFSNLSKYVDA